MNKILKRTSSNPHPDIELNFQRYPMDYYLTIPDSLNSETGILFYIPGRLEFAGENNQIIRPHLVNKQLANTFNCIAVSVDYFGVYSNPTNNLKADIEVENLLNSLRVYDIDKSMLFEENQTTLLPDAFDRLTEYMKQKGINIVENSCSVKINHLYGKRDYASFGFMPSIDYIHVLGQILKEFPKLNRRRIISYGRSYGGSVSLLKGKYAPKSFSAIVNNSGFIKPHLYWMISNELYVPHKFQILGGSHIVFTSGDKKIDFPGINFEPWTLVDEYSPYYYSDANRKIRSLLDESHCNSSDTKYYIAHSVDDDLIPISEVDDAVNILIKHKSVFYKRIEEKDIDGTVFKSIEHCMDVEPFEFLDYMSKIDGSNFVKQNDSTDFDLNSEYNFICSDKVYTFKYKDDFSLNVAISEL